MVPESDRARATGNADSLRAKVQLVRADNDLFVLFNGIAGLSVPLPESNSQQTEEAECPNSPCVQAQLLDIRPL